MVKLLFYHRSAFCLPTYGYRITLAVFQLAFEIDNHIASEEKGNKENRSRTKYSILFEIIGHDMKHLEIGSILTLSVGQYKRKKNTFRTFSANIFTVAAVQTQRMLPNKL